MTSEVRVWYRDGNLNRVAQCDDRAVFTCQLVQNDRGTWQLTLPLDSIAATVALATLWDEGLGGIEAQLNGRHLIAGPLWQYEINKPSGKPQELVLTGFDDNVWLARRTILPVPTGSPYHPEFDIRHAKPDAAMRLFVLHNLGDSADLNGRRLQNRDATDILHTPAVPGVGSDSTWWARFDNLLDMLRLIANSYGLVFRIIPCPTTAGRLDFVVYEPIDRSGTVRFSQDLGNLEEYVQTRRAASANHLIGGGIGAGEGRLIVELADSASVAKYGRIEEFVDFRQAHDTSAMTTHLSSALGEKSDAFAVLLTPIEVPNLKFLADYDIGDMVSLDTDDEDFVATVGQVDVESTGAAGVKVQPYINSLGLVPRQSSPIVSQLRGLSVRVSQLERFGENPAQSGMVVEWDGTLADLQDPWKVCDGTAGTPDLRDKFIVTAGLAYVYGATGGSAELPEHSHPIPHEHNPSGGTANMTGSNDTDESAASGGTQVADDGHKHRVGPPTVATTSDSIAGIDSMPPYYALYRIKYLPT